MERREKRQRTGQGGRQVASAALILGAILFGLPGLALRGEPLYHREPLEELTPQELPLEPAVPTAPARDPTPAWTNTWVGRLSSCSAVPAKMP